MVLNNKLYDLFSHQANLVQIETLCIGVGYTSVTTSDGGIGIAYTYLDGKNSCFIIKDYYNFEGKPAIELLEYIKESEPVKRSAALALINALNHEKSLLLPEDSGKNALWNTFFSDQGKNIAMVGFFKPLIKRLDQNDFVLEIIDEGRAIGHKQQFYEKLGNWADILVLSSTSVLNNTTEEILENAGQKVKTVLLGPSTPMVPEAFEHLPVNMLAGTVILKQENALKAVRHGAGTPVIQKFGRKISLKLS